MLFFPFPLKSFGSDHSFAGSTENSFGMSVLSAKNELSMVAFNSFFNSNIFFTQISAQWGVFVGRWNFLWELE